MLDYAFGKWTQTLNDSDSIEGSEKKGLRFFFFSLASSSSLQAKPAWFKRSTTYLGFLVRLSYTTIKLFPGLLPGNTGVRITCSLLEYGISIVLLLQSVLKALGWTPTQENTPIAQLFKASLCILRNDQRKFAVRNGSDWVLFDCMICCKVLNE